MNLLFVEPPKARRVGGIETALSGWASSLIRLGVGVTRREAPSESELTSADVVHFHGLWEGSHPSLRRRCGDLTIPFVVSPHGMLEPWAFRHKSWKKKPYFYLLERPSLKKAAAILATSALEARGLATWFPAEQIRVLPLGTDTTVRPDYEAARSALGWHRNERVVVFLSRLHEKKGLHLLIDAWRQLSCPGRLVIVGEGDPGYVAPLKTVTQGVAGIEWAGPRWGSEKWPLLQGADLVCLPSFSENFGLVVLEALQVGTPVITTPGTPWGELAGDLPVTITEPERRPLSLALERVLKAPVQHSRDSLHALVAARFDWSSLARQYLELYQNVSARRHAR